MFNKYRIVIETEPRKLYVVQRKIFGLWFELFWSQDTETVYPNVFNNRKKKKRIYHRCDYYSQQDAREFIYNRLQKKNKKPKVFCEISSNSNSKKYTIMEVQPLISQEMFFSFPENFFNKSSIVEISQTNGTLKIKQTFLSDEEEKTLNDVKAKSHYHHVTFRGYFLKKFTWNPLTMFETPLDFFNECNINRAYTEVPVLFCITVRKSETEPTLIRVAQMTL